MSLSDMFSNSRELIVQAAKIFGSKEEAEIETIARRVVRQMLAEGYSLSTQSKRSTNVPNYGPNPRPLPDNIQTMTVSMPTVIVSGACTMYGYAENGEAQHYGEVLRIRDANVLTEYPSIFNGQIRDIVCNVYGSQPNMSSTLLYIKKGGHDSKYPPPLGQMVVPCGYGLAVLKVPAGVSITVWYTIP
jgi:hypothetical protein